MLGITWMYDPFPTGVPALCPLPSGPCPLPLVPSLDLTSLTADPCIAFDVLPVLPLPALSLVQQLSAAIHPSNILSVQYSTARRLAPLVIIGFVVCPLSATQRDNCSILHYPTLPYPLPEPDEKPLTPPPTAPVHASSSRPSSANPRSSHPSHSDRLRDPPCHSYLPLCLSPKSAILLHIQPHHHRHSFSITTTRRLWLAVIQTTS
ncbi:hypothetical protein VTL71DRAFT_15526 [Oculimacula yallundae]|uniref:Uncharacterized protein n=1 Tax=Oculimacula yallundae TaxID=86028 RepID=A0ABR4CJ05_9HELO